MPVTVEGKLELFRKVLIEHIEEEWDEKREQLVKDMDERLSEKSKELKKQMKTILRERQSRAGEKRKTVITKIQSEADDELAKIKENYLVNLVNTLKDWCIQFIDSDEYKAFLTKNIEDSMKMMKGENWEISLLKKDKDKFGTLIMNNMKNEKNIEFVESSPDNIGGFTLVDKDNGIMVDLSIKTLLDEGKEYMGKLLYKELDEV